MAEALSILPHQFDFIDENRSDLVFTGAIRLDPSMDVNAVQLTQDQFGNYPTDNSDNFVISPAFAPKAVRAWVGFQVGIQHVNNGITQLTGDGYRLHDGVNQWWWNGSAWVQSTTQWSSEADIANNISTFPATTRQLRVVVKLSTTDRTVTPTLNWVRIAWQGKVYPIEDIIYRTLVPALRQVRVVMDFVIKIAFPGGTSLDVGSAVNAAKEPINVVDVESVFNNNSDPDQLTNLLSSYNPNTGIATLSTAIPVGQVARCRLVLQPQIAVESTSQDYGEVEKVPALQVVDIETVDSQPLAQTESVTNKATGAAYRIPPPYRFNLRFTMIALTAGGVDLLRLVDALVEYVENNPMLTSAQTGEKYRLWLVDEFHVTTKPNLPDVNSSEATLMIMDVASFKKPTTLTTAVKTLHTNLGT